MADKNEEKKAASPAPCGHENKHFISAVDPATGKVLNEDKLICALGKGHEGDHEADYLTLSGGLVVKKRAAWTDAAGEPAA